MAQDRLLSLEDDLPDRPKLLFITGHSFLEPQRVSVHFMALAAAEAGYDVRIFVAGVGASALAKSPEICGAIKGRWIGTSAEILEYVAWQFHTPVDLRSRVLNALSSPLVAAYGRTLPRSVKWFAGESMAIILESGVAAPYLRALARGGFLGKTIYLAADDIRTVRAHPVIRYATKKYGGKLKGCLSFGAHHNDSFLGQTPVIVVPKGIDARAYEKGHPSPYGTGRPVVVSVGNMLFEPRFLEIAREYPGADWHFIGRIDGTSQGNVFVHGPMEFDKTIAYIQHADVGLLPYRPAANMGYLKGSSMKLAQYRACGLPIVGPAQLNDGIAYHAFAEAEGSSVTAAVDDALAAGKAHTSAAVTDFRDNWRTLEQMISGRG